jgi:hypothetical protein
MVYVSPDGIIIDDCPFIESPAAAFNVKSAFPVLLIVQLVPSYTSQYVEESTPAHDNSCEEIKVKEVKLLSLV